MIKAAIAGFLVCFGAGYAIRSIVPDPQPQKRQMRPVEPLCHKDEVRVQNMLESIPEDILSRMPFRNAPERRLFVANHAAEFGSLLASLEGQIKNDVVEAERCYWRTGEATSLKFVIGWQLQSAANEWEMTRPELFTVPPGDISKAKSCVQGLLSAFRAHAARPDARFPVYTGLLPLAFQMNPRTRT